MENSAHPCVAVLSGSNFLVWSAEDALILRSKFRITGKLIGAQIRQVKKSGPDNVVKGLVSLPLSLSRYEVDLGLREGFLTVLIEDINDWMLSEEDQAKAVAARVLELERNAERSRRDAFALKIKYTKQELSVVEYEAALLELAACSPPGHVELEGLVVPSSSSFSTVPLTSPIGIPKKKLGKIDFKSDHEARCGVVFRDLWRQGYFISDAVKFGGDFLAYPGDPMKYHAQFIVQVKSPSDQVRGIEISSSARLGVRVKKPLVIATVLVDGLVSYMLLEWLGTT